MGGCDDPDCDCGGGGGPDGVVAISASVSLHTSIVCLYEYLYRCGTNQFKSILEFLETMEDEIGNITEKVEDLSASHKVHEKRCDNDDVITTNKINAMNDKVLEIRQLIGVNALSQGLASFKIINEMKRKAIIDENGFMVTIEDQKPQYETIEDKNESSALEDDNKRMKSPRKGKMTAPKFQGREIKEQKRKQSLRAKGDDPTHNWKMLSEAIGFTAKNDPISEEGDFVRNGKDTSSNSSETFDEKLTERPRGARNKTRTHPESPRKRTKSPTKKLEGMKRSLPNNLADNGSEDIRKQSSERSENNEDRDQQNEDKMDTSSSES